MERAIEQEIEQEIERAINNRFIEPCRTNPADPWQAVLVDTKDSEEDPAEDAILPGENRLMNT